MIKDVVSDKGVSSDKRILDHSEIDIDTSKNKSSHNSERSNMEVN